MLAEVRRGEARGEVDARIDRDVATSATTCDGCDVTCVTITAVTGGTSTAEFVVDDIDVTAVPSHRGSR